MPAGRTPYEILGVPVDADEDQIRAAYRRLVKQLHPDVGGSAAVFDIVREAYEVLSNPTRRDPFNSAAAGAGPAQRESEPPPSASRSGSNRPDRETPEADPMTEPSKKSPTSMPPRRKGRWLLPAVVLVAVAVTVLRLVVPSAEDSGSTSWRENEEAPQAEDLDPSTPSTGVMTGATGAITTAPPVLTCDVFAPVRVTYELASETMYGGVKYWPVVTVANGGTSAVLVEIAGHGVVRKSDHPEMPTWIFWSADVSVPAGQSGSTALGVRTGEVLAVFEGDSISSIELEATADLDEESSSTVGRDLGPCDLTVAAA